MGKCQKIVYAHDIILNMNQSRCMKDFNTVKNLAFSPDMK